jgi:hypothetical protein
VVYRSLKTQMLLNPCLYGKYVVVHAGQSANKIVFVCKLHYVIKEFGVGNPLFTPTTLLMKEEILVRHRSVLFFLVISIKDEELDLPSPHSTRFPTCTNVLTSNDMLLSLPMRHATSFQIMIIYCNRGLNPASILL